MLKKLMCTSLEVNEIDASSGYTSSTLLQCNLVDFCHRRAQRYALKCELEFDP